jgi:hypothetical protein
MGFCHKFPSGTHLKHTSALRSTFPPTHQARWFKEYYFCLAYRRVPDKILARTPFIMRFLAVFFILSRHIWYQS